MPNTSRQHAQPRNVTMYPRQWEAVESCAQERGFGSNSAALRAIVEEWGDLRASVATTRARCTILEDRYLELLTASHALLTLDPETDHDGPRANLAAAVQRGTERLQPGLPLPFAEVPR